MKTAQLMLDQYVRVDSINTRYWNAGEQGDSVVLLHGGGSSIEVWTHNIQVLAQRYRVFAFDMVGTGLTDKPSASYSLEYQLQFLQSFLDTFGIQKVSLIGNSMGGSIALKFALELPERVQKLGLVSSFGLGREHCFRDRLLAAFPGVANLIPLSRSGTRMVLKNCVYNPKVIPEEWVDHNFKRVCLLGQKEALISLLTSNIDFWGVQRKVFDPIVQQLGHIKAPTLIIWGRQDSIIPVAHACMASQKIPNSSLHIFEQCGHWAQVEHPKEFNRLVLEFLS